MKTNFTQNLWRSDRLLAAVVHPIHQDLRNFLQTMLSVVEWRRAVLCAKYRVALWKEEDTGPLRKSTPTLLKQQVSIPFGKHRSNLPRGAKRVVSSQFNNVTRVGGLAKYEPLSDSKFDWVRMLASRKAEPVMKTISGETLQSKFFPFYIHWGLHFVFESDHVEVWRLFHSVTFASLLITFQ